METIFDKIPSAQDVQRWINKDVQEAMESFISRIAKALEKMNSWSVTLQADRDGALFNGIHGEKIKDALKKKWWDIKYTPDQRDWDYFTISMSNLEYPSGVWRHQCDR